MSGIPLRAMLLWVVLGPGFFGLGMIVASWVVELTLVLWRDGLAGVGQLRIAWWGWAHPPHWIDPKADFDTYNRLELLSLILSIPGAIVFSVLGMKLWRFLVVNKFKWMTEEEVRELRKRQRQIM